MTPERPIPLIHLIDHCPAESLEQMADEWRIAYLRWEAWIAEQVAESARVMAEQPEPEPAPEPEPPKPTTRDRIVELCNCRGMTADEISKEVGWTVGSVHKNLVQLELQGRIKKILKHMPHSRRPVSVFYANQN